MEQTKTKKALIMSVLSVFLCIAMLIGMTFAWFTDTASTGVNKIEAGTLKVAIVNEEGNSIENNTLNFVDKNSSSNILWEPGVTFKTTGFKIKNLGNLALKYKLSLNGVTGDNELLKVITFSVVDKDGNAVNLDDFEDNLTAKGEMSDMLYIQGHMDEAAGNEYQNKSVDGIGITVIATQLSAEYDSFNNTYDSNAAYPAKALKNALEQGGSVKLNDDIEISPVIEDKTQRKLVPQMTVSKDTVLNLNGKKLGIASGDFGNATPNLIAVTNGTLTVNGNGTIDCDADGNQVYGININGGKAVINSGTFYGGMTAIQVQKGSLEINGGFFDMTADCKAVVPQYAKYIINVIDKAYKDGTATISIKGGTFVNFDPSDNPEGTGTSYVADGYKVTSATQTNGDVWYKVVAE